MEPQSQSRDHLIRTYLSVERQVTRLKQLVQSNQKRVSDLENRISLVSETRKLVQVAQEQQPELDHNVVCFERLLAKVEALAASENSRNNSTPEVRRINQRIEEALDEVHKAERKASQATMDCSLLEHEIEGIKAEFSERKEAATIRLETVYKTIQEIRQEISNARKANLEKFLEKQERLARAEIENQRLLTQTMMYKQLVMSVQQELDAIGSDKGLAVLNKEVEKIDAAIQSIPVREPPSNDERQKEMFACTRMTEQINATEEEIKNSIAKMSRAENDQDTLTHELQDAEDRKSEMRSALDSAEALTQELEKQRERLKSKEATNAQDEINNLEYQTSALGTRIDRNLRRLEEFKGMNDDANAIPLSMGQLVMKMRNEYAKLSEKTKRLDYERLDLHERNARVNLPGEPF